MDMVSHRPNREVLGWVVTPIRVARASESGAPRFLPDGVLGPGWTRALPGATQEFR
jgi:hypothetical protein